MRYAVVDVEWVNQPIWALAQIGGIMFGSKHKELSRIYHVVKLDCKTFEKGFRQAKFDPEMFENGISKKTAMNNFLRWLNGCSKVIVWNEAAVNILRKLFKKYVPNVYPEIIALQNKYNEYFWHKSFEKLCERYSIEINKPLHISINDCEYLTKLYRIVTCDKLPETVGQNFPTFEERHKSDVEASRYWTLRGSKVFHNKDCHYVKNRDKERIIPLFNYCHADVLGYAPCKCCNPQSPEQHTDDVVWDFNAIKGYCSKLNIDCKVRNKLIYITTSAASWFFFTNRMYIILYHESRRRNHAKAWGNLSKSFHIQDKTFTDPIDAIYYIYCHDMKTHRK